MEEWFDIDLEERPIVLVDKVSEVCAVPQSAQRVMELTRTQETQVGSLVNAVVRDPALAAEILRIANSPVFGQARQVNDLRRAIVVIGLQELHNMAAAMAMLAAFPANEALSEQLHMSSVLSATMCRMLAEKLGGVDPTTAFLSGLLCEIGAMACIFVDAEEYERIWNESHGSAELRAQNERKRYGATSEQIGARMLERNQLPAEVVKAIEASALTPPSQMDPLAKVTVFSRQSAPLLIRAANETDADILNNDIPTLAERLWLTDLTSEQIVKICIESGTAAELGLRGEAELLNCDEVPDASEEKNEPDERGQGAPADTPQPQVTLDIQSPLATPKKGTRLAPAIVILLLLAIGGGVAAYFLGYLGFLFR